MARSSSGPPRGARGSGAQGRRSAWPRECPFTRRDGALFRHGRHFTLHEKLGARRGSCDGKTGYWFTVWAPAAASVHLIGEFNGWDDAAQPMERLADAGVWTTFVEHAQPGALYKYRIRSRLSETAASKADPFALRCETPPGTASMVWDTDYEWDDAQWMGSRGKRDPSGSPMSIYEMHLGSWRRDQAHGHLDYRELAEQLVPYLREMQFTHVELLPPMEHPFYGSWGYQTTGYFAPTSRYGSPQDLMHLIDRLHQAGIGVILDWVPSHFPGDGHSLALFDGTHLFEHADMRRGFHPDWRSFIFNYERPEVCSFLVSSALFWVERFHADALRVDAVASMLYRDYSRGEGEWEPNKFGGRENLEAITFLRTLNREIHERHDDVYTIAEESTAWPMVSRPEHLGGLGFDMKWDMGWMHDTLNYMSQDPVYRKFHHGGLTFRQIYAFAERFVMPLSHDEVVHGKRSLLDKMPGDAWQKFANLRLLLGLMYGQSGKKLLFMGAELGEWREWNHDSVLSWDALRHPSHAGLQRWVRDLNAAYRAQPALHELDFDGEGFRWIDCSDSEQSVISFERRARKSGRPVIVVCNFTPVPRYNYRIGVDHGGSWHELLNSDATTYAGSGLGNMGAVEAVPMRYHDRAFSINLTLPPLSILYLTHDSPPKPLPGTER
ncbi:MAG: 1,4-alpha-glucan branching protein GlgB [bacterium]|nr:1,4-alpha-glucan branching protein GlgB [bacterium]